MNSIANIKNLTELVIQSDHVKMVSNIHGTLQEIYAQVYPERTFMKVNSLTGKSLADCSNLDLVRSILELIQLVHINQQPGFVAISFSTTDLQIQLDCDIFPLPNQKFLVTLNRNFMKSEVNASEHLTFTPDQSSTLELQDASPLIQNIMDQTQEIWFAVSTNGRVLFCNQKFLELLEYEDQDISELTLLDLISSEQKETIQSLFFTREGNTGFLDLKMISRTGQTIPVRVKLFTIAEDDHRLMLGIVRRLPGDPLGIVNSTLETFLKLTSRVPLPLMLIDEMTQEILFANPTACSYLEYEEIELKALNLFDLFPPSENPYLVKVVRNAGIIGMEADFSWRLTTKNGSGKIVQFLMQQILFENRKTVVMIILDNPEDSKMSYIKEEPKHLDYFEEDLMMVRLTPDGIIKQVNQKFCDLIGRPLRKVIGRSFEENLFVEDYAGIFNHFSKLTPQNPIRKNTSRVLNADGKTFWVEWTDRGIFEDDQLMAIYAIGRDVSDSYQHDLLQQSMEQRFQALVENLPMVVYVVDARTLFPLYISPQVEKYTGYTPEELYRSPEVWLSAMHPEDGKNFYEVLRERIDQKITKPVEFRVYHKNGSLHWAEEIGSTITMPDGTVLFQGISRDVTARHNAREKLIYYSNFEHLINEISLNLMNASSEDINQVLQNTVEALGEYMQVDRAYIFDFNDSEQTMSNTFEWCNKCITPQMDNLQNVPMTPYPWWINKMVNNEEITLDSLDELPAESAPIKDLLAQQDIISLLVVPMFNNGQASGFIGFDMVSNKTHWEAEAIHILRLASAMIVSTRERLQKPC